MLKLNIITRIIINLDIIINIYYLFIIISSTYCQNIVLIWILISK